MNINFRKKKNLFRSIRKLIKFLPNEINEIYEQLFKY